MLPERAWEWAMTFPADHPLAELGGVYQREEDVRRDMDQWRCAALYRRRVWRARWRLAEVKGWDAANGRWELREQIIPASADQHLDGGEQ